MEAAVIVGVIAASVSLASVAANLYVAKQTRESSAVSLRLKARLDREDAAIKTIREVEIEGEKLRIHCWDVINQLQSFGRKAATHSSKKAEALLTEDFIHQAKLFLDKWAMAKGNLPETAVERLSMIRHECRHLIDDALILSEKVVSKDSESLGAVIDRLQELLAQVNRFTQTVTDIRRELWP